MLHLELSCLLGSAQHHCDVHHQREQGGPVLGAEERGQHHTLVEHINCTDIFADAYHCTTRYNLPQKVFFFIVFLYLYCIVSYIVLTMCALLRSCSLNFIVLCIIQSHTFFYLLLVVRTAAATSKYVLLHTVCIQLGHDFTD